MTHPRQQQALNGNNFGARPSPTATATASPMTASSPMSYSSQSPIGPKTSVAAGSPDRSRMGTTCHQGLVIVETLSVDVGVERAQDLRIMGPMFLSLSVVFSLGSVDADRTSAKRGSEKVSWSPPERRELLWDAEERWLWLRVYDGGDFTGYQQLAGEGRVDLLSIVNQRLAESTGAKASGPGLVGGAAQEIELELFAHKEENSGSEGEGNSSLDQSIQSDGNSFSRLAGQTANLGLPSRQSYHEVSDPTDPANGLSIGAARIRLTIIDMTGMLSSQEKKPIVGMVPTQPAESVAWSLSRPNWR
eukprot:TRINITY_DN14554_c0_g1_i1.p1 TRINITY_DN14554_c0_g1~~TRINITY_DN14554_c0_g1_i1.p1  ORF type:complete len:350 (-),score=44.52 TRINITY_DN14554_c0_g1_i1:94-1005(-)